MKAKRFVTALWMAAVVVAGVAGCCAPRTSSEGVFDEAGIPVEGFRVGGGFQIRYVAPAAGTAYLVDQSMGTLLGTESLTRGQVFEFLPTSEVVDGFRRVGIDLSEGEFVLYFVPASRLYCR